MLKFLQMENCANTIFGGCGNGHISKAILNSLQTSAASTRQFCLPLSSKKSDQPGILNCRSPSIIRTPIIGAFHRNTTSILLERRVRVCDEISWNNSLAPQKNNQWGFPLTAVPDGWKSFHLLELLLGAFFRRKKSPISFLFPFLLRFSHSKVYCEEAWGLRREMRIRTDFSSYSTMLKFILFVQRLSYPFKFLQSSIVFFVVLVLRKIFYIKERKWSRLFGNYLSNKVRTITCQKKNMKKSITERIKTNIEYMLLAIPFVAVMSLTVFALKPFHRQWCENILYLPKYVSWYRMAENEKERKLNQHRGFPRHWDKNPSLTDIHREQREFWGGHRMGCTSPTSQLMNTTACSVPGAAFPFPLLGVFMAFWLI